VVIEASFALHESGNGTKLPIRDVRNPVATGGKPDIAQKARFGSD
jgi:hypothetical protein